MADRQQQISQLQMFIGKIETEVTMILQHLQWDSKHLLESKPMVGCKYNENHRVPDSSRGTHEQKCLLNANGYSKEDVLLPDPLDTNSSSLVKLSKMDMNQIINKAAAMDSSFRKGVSSTQVSENGELEPLSLARLQARYGADERRALHDAVVSAAPACHDLSDLALPSDTGEPSAAGQQRSRAEILAELRDMKRRRTKYRVAAKTSNYSHVLRDVIKTQMEVYTDVKVEDSSKPQTDNKRQELVQEKQKHLPSKYPPSLPYHSSNKNESHKVHRKYTSEDRSYEGIGSDCKRRRHNDFNHDPSKTDKLYREEKYNNDERQSGSKRTQYTDFEENYAAGRNSYKERKHREEKYYDDDSRSANKRKRSKYFANSDSDGNYYRKDREYREEKYQNDDIQADSQRNRGKGFEEYSSQERKDYKERKYRDKYEKEDRADNKSKLNDVETNHSSSRANYKEERDGQRKHKKRHDDERYRSDRKQDKTREYNREKYIDY